VKHSLLLAHRLAERPGVLIRGLGLKAKWPSPPPGCLTPYARMFVSASRLLCYDPLLMSVSMSSKFPERGPVRSSDRKRFLLSLSVKQVNPMAQFQ